MSLGTTVPYAGRAYIKQEAYEACAACIGLDWADATHDVCLQAAGSEHREHFSRAHTPADIEARVGSLHKRCEGKPGALCLELAKGPVVFALCFRCWQDRTPYNASVSLQALNRRGASLIHNLANGP